MPVVLERPGGHPGAFGGSPAHILVLDPWPPGHERTHACGLGSVSGRLCARASSVFPPLSVPWMGAFPSGTLQGAGRHSGDMGTHLGKGRWPQSREGAVRVLPLLSPHWLGLCSARSTGGGTAGRYHCSNCRREPQGGSRVSPQGAARGSACKLKSSEPVTQPTEAGTLPGTALTAPSPTGRWPQARVPVPRVLEGWSSSWAAARKLWGGTQGVSVAPGREQDPPPAGWEPRVLGVHGASPSRAGRAEARGGGSQRPQDTGISRDREDRCL